MKCKDNRNNIVIHILSVNGQCNDGLVISPSPHQSLTTNLPAYNHRIPIITAIN